MPIKKNSVFTIHLGCSKNQVDAECMLSELLASDFSISQESSTANYIIINTCGFIEPAKEESIDIILSQIKDKKKSQKIIVTGCLSERYKHDLPIEIPGVDYWLGTYKPGELLKLLGFSEKHICETVPTNRINFGSFSHHAYLKIAEGCNRRCAFCAIPNIRGKQVSRSIDELVLEAQQLEAQGVKELTLVAQDTTYFGREKGKKGGTLQTLLEALLEHTTIPWIRTLYWYPDFIDDGLLDLIAKEPRLCKYIDMPIQHASDRQLKLMSRRYNQSTLYSLLNKIKEKIPGVSLRTTVLVGFPGESHEDFEELMSLIQKIQFDHLGGFIYSPEEDTPAEKITADTVSESEARLRLDMITEYQEDLAMERNETLIGKKIRIIIDEVAEESEFHFYGRTEGSALDTDDIVKVIEGNAEIGSFYDALVVDAAPHELICNIL